METKNAMALIPPSLFKQHAFIFSRNNLPKLFCVIIFLFFAGNLDAQTGQVNNLDHPFTIVFQDSTPAHLTMNEWDELEILSVETGKPNIGIRVLQEEMENNGKLVSLSKGSFVLTFLDHELIRFQVTESSGKLTTDFPNMLTLPLNYLIKGEPDQEVMLMDQACKVVSHHKTEPSGYLWLSEPIAFYGDKFLVGIKSGQLPQIHAFKKINPKYNIRLDSRRSSLPNSMLRPGSGTVHNLDRDSYHHVQEVKFTNATKERIYVLRSYSPNTDQEKSIKIQIPPSLSKMFPGSLVLDYKGDLVLPIGNQNYFLGLNGGLTEDQGISINPYKFHNHYVSEYGQWIIPIYAGVALTEGGHELKVTCTGSWFERTAEQKIWSKKNTELNIEINKLYEIIQKTNEPSERYEELLKERNKHLGQKPTYTKEKNTAKGSKSSSESFQVIHAPANEFPWRIESKLNDSDDPNRYYSPSGLDPKDSLWLMDKEVCETTLDGMLILKEEYSDDEIDQDNEQEQSSRKLMLFEDTKLDITSKRPYNMMEGPYPDLRYTYREMTGTYPNIKEAREHCSNPSRNKDVYHCYDEKLLSVCLDNYSYEMVDDRIVTNYDALYCKEEAIQKDPSKGDEIVVEVSADGFLPTTRALSKRDKEVSEILFNGHITDKRGNPIHGALVKLKNLGAEIKTEKDGSFHLFANASGAGSYQESMDVKLQQIGIEVSNEVLGIYDSIHFGIVSDGFTTLKLQVKTNGIRPQTVSASQPEIGEFVPHATLHVPLVVKSDGTGELEYIPPAYLNEYLLTKELALQPGTDSLNYLSDKIWGVDVPVTITYEDEEGNPGSYDIRIFVTRPPIFLIHGFTGNETTWAILADYLRARKYEPLVREYYKGPADESTIQRQSQKLGKYIQEVRQTYLDNHILQTRIDIVAHSMGGLISRYYINNMSKYGEKAGIVIPYNVRLSRDELAAARFQTPVKLNDVRKLIMVGTPNHGATWIDSRLGHLGALMSDYHQVANSQLRSDSDFFRALNEGENVGRHLDANVQYALLYGIRKRSPLYPPDMWAIGKKMEVAQRKLADDDGVVAVSSAILNGILNIPFPANENNQYGYIHSPDMSTPFPGDVAITTDGEIFSKIDDLLLEDIPRFPLVNSSIKIIRVDGNASLRYYAHNGWQKLNPINRISPLTLENSWCQFKTEDGAISVAFLIDGCQWASLHIQDGTILHMDHMSPEYVKVYLQQGKARFRSRTGNGGGFEVVMGEQGEKWYNFNPKAKVRDIGTDFIIEKGETVKVHSIYGEVAIGSALSKDKIGKKDIKKKEGVKINDSGEMEDNPLPEFGWWTTIDTTYLNDSLATDSIEPQNLIINGSFEEGPTVGAYLTLRQGDTIPGWEVTQTGIDLIGTYFKSADGDLSIDLTGTPGYGSLQQKVNTTPGSTYKILFKMAGNPMGSPMIKRMRVQAAGQSQNFEFDITGKNSREMGWQENSWQFTAKSVETIIEFSAMEESPATSCGPAIDHIRMYQEKEKVVPLQQIGKVDIQINDPFLPVSGFTQLEVIAENDKGKALSSPYEVDIQLVNPKKHPFIDITNAQGVINESGIYETDITIGEPNPKDYTSLNEIPLSATFNIHFRNPRTNDIVLEQTIERPIGMTLLHGQTVGPNYIPRQEPLPPEFLTTSYQVANEADQKGNFYILFNTTLFKKDIDRFKNLAERTKELFTMDVFDFALQWSETCSVPLKYAIPDSIKDQIEPGEKMKLGKNGVFDLLTPEEHETRIKQMVIGFIEKMPLKTNEKAEAINQLEKVSIRYGSTNDIHPPTLGNLKEDNSIHSLTSINQYWTHEFYKSEGDPAYTMMLHSIGHLLQQSIVSFENHYYDFLSNKCSGSRNLWTYENMEEEGALFDPSGFIAFHEAGADFFSYLFYNYINRHEKAFVDQSIYYDRGYASSFSNDHLARDAKSKYPNDKVSGSQTSFLAGYYGKDCLEAPAAAYADFLSGYVSLSRGQNISMTMTDWVQAMEFADNGLGRSPDTLKLLAQHFGISTLLNQASLFPLTDFKNASIELDQQIISDFSNIPKIELQEGNNLKVLNGHFLISRRIDQKTKLMDLSNDCIIKVGTDGLIEMHSGALISKSPLILGDKLATISGEEMEYLVLFLQKYISIHVLRGKINAVSAKDEVEVSAGEYTTMNYKGAIKKPRLMKMDVLQQFRDRANWKYDVHDPFRFETRFSEYAQ
jgi:choice-of-anchor C domain-containing protein